MKANQRKAGWMKAIVRHLTTKDAHDTIEMSNYVWSVDEEFGYKHGPTRNSIAMREINEVLGQYIHIENSDIPLGRGIRSRTYSLTVDPGIVFNAIDLYYGIALAEPLKETVEARPREEPEFVNITGAIETPSKFHMVTLLDFLRYAKDYQIRNQKPYPYIFTARECSQGTFANPAVRYTIEEYLEYFKNLGEYLGINFNVKINYIINKMATSEADKYRRYGLSFFNIERTVMEVENLLITNYGMEESDLDIDPDKVVVPEIVENSMADPEPEPMAPIKSAIKTHVLPKKSNDNKPVIDSKDIELTEEQVRNIILSVAYVIENSGKTEVDRKTLLDTITDEFSMELSVPHVMKAILKSGFALTINAEGTVKFGKGENLETVKAKFGKTHEKRHLIARLTGWTEETFRAMTGLDGRVISEITPTDGIYEINTDTSKSELRKLVDLVRTFRGADTFLNMGPDFEKALRNSAQNIDRVWYSIDTNYLIETKVGHKQP